MSYTNDISGMHNLITVNQLASTYLHLFQLWLILEKRMRWQPYNFINFSAVWIEHLENKYVFFDESKKLFLSELTYYLSQIVVRLTQL